MRPERWGVVAAAATLAACQAFPGLDPAPAACAPLSFKGAPALPLPPAEPPAGVPQKGRPLKFANAIPLGGGVGDVGAWTDVAAGWRAWRLKLRSEGAKSLSLHVKPLVLPEAAELWLCEPEGGLRQGPLTGTGPAGSGEVWTAEVPGPELWVEILAPAATAPVVRMRIVEAFAAYR